MHSYVKRVPQVDDVITNCDHLRTLNDMLLMRLHARNLAVTVTSEVEVAYEEDANTPIG